MKYEELTRQIIKAFYEVYNTLGYGFLEKVYERAIAIELRERGFKVDSQNQVFVYYKSHVVGDYSSDLTVDDVVICEIKTSERLSHDNECQLINYLKGTNIEVGLLLNFGKKPEFRRKVYDNERKEWYTNRLL